VKVVIPGSGTKKAAKRNREEEEMLADPEVQEADKFWEGLALLSAEEQANRVRARQADRMKAFYAKWDTGAAPAPPAAAPHKTPAKAKKRITPTLVTKR